jgi:hypothetical protein
MDDERKRPIWGILTLALISPEEREALFATIDDDDDEFDNVVYLSEYRLH